MAGKLIVDTIDTDNAFITLNVQQSLIATMNVSGIYSNTGVKMVGADGTVGSNLTATNLAGGSNGTIPYQSANGVTQMLAVGTAGQVLQTNGAGAPSWATPSSTPFSDNTALAQVQAITLCF